MDREPVEEADAVTVQPLKESSKASILAAAGALFSRKGYHGTTIREIAEARGILSGSLYAHISSKEDLLFEIADEGATAFLEALRPVVEADRPASEKLLAGLTAHIQVVATRLDAARVFFHEWYALREPRRSIIFQKRVDYEQLWSKILEEGVQSGEFQARDTQFARLLILSAANWVYQWYHRDGPDDPERIARRFTQLILDGIGQHRGGEDE
ncbi:MAG: TetR/AcrR family transcriptional regulator [Alicyclobacillaceae bacterium]|uniref:TetR/AcrR family transcriptional regulator n=1 Tax=Alicyclobacillus sp. SP_1 TaxID=2942475 RepID=UPI0021577AF6|nr:TetR/AcrR family transcriptional regulator [Alicyclobacillus sp. SP_1]MCY0888617.1 TetR/AcrR family transcriptional regulator [Alicyclobacillaceae bacterium]MCY0896623.1 TetR/AcrR family transcriptional regulator [Alicyclobacillaceae bacterium]